MGVMNIYATIEDFVSYIKTNKTIRLSKDQEKAVAESAKRIEKIIERNAPVYGVNTGFGALCDKIIRREDIKQLQTNLIKSHACGVGQPLSKEETKGTMFLLINSLAKGYSGIRPSTLDTLIQMYNKEVLPVIPEKGSLGASGDLIPLAHLALVLIGEGKAYYNNKMLSGKTAMKKACIKPVSLEAKEGLALINGTHAITSIAALNLYYANNLSKTADIAAAMTLEALKGSPKNFDTRIHALKPHPGQKQTAENMRRLIEGSRILSPKYYTCEAKQNIIPPHIKKKIDQHKQSKKVQDPYSIRCTPQIHGPVKEELEHIKSVLETEMNSVTDNPLVFEDECISGGNFHGQYIATAMDNLASTLTIIGSVSERRTERLLNKDYSSLPAFLTENNGLNSGLMITQYLSAALLSINKILSYPASNTSLPVSANQEDFVSMAMTSSSKAKEVIKNLEYVIAIELLCASQALEFHEDPPGRGTSKAYQVIRENVKPLKKDRTLYQDIEKVYNLVHEKTILEEVEKTVGKLR
ncbi:histidine ammonia-lyase [Candidatus Woesearchaeota archaeon]|nr:histidine ammonia-lyase [Candidatus Woesearchaeota archaeon]